MANSGIDWIDLTFDFCVTIYEIANAIGITYEEINVWLFVIALPLLLAFSLALNLWLLCFCQRKMLLISLFNSMHHLQRYFRIRAIIVYCFV